MDTIDNRGKLYELEEIFKYKNLINISDNQIIKEIIFDEGDKANTLYNDFIKLVAQEVDHILNKTQFAEKKDELITNMQQHLSSRKA